MRPERLVLVAGTGTDVGKTWIAAALARRLAAAGARVAARKPIQSSDPSDALTDADVLAAATGEPAETVCPRHRWLPIPMAPPIAAALAGRSAFTIAELVDELRWPDGADVGLVEAAGGVRSPLADDGDTATLAAALVPDLTVLVADARLGAIHAVRSSLPALDGLAVVVALNRYDAADPVHIHNRRWLVDRDHLRVVTDVDALATLVSPALALSELS